MNGYCYYNYSQIYFCIVTFTILDCVSVCCVWFNYFTVSHSATGRSKSMMMMISFQSGLGRTP